jgi:hypothetical protein
MRSSGDRRGTANTARVRREMHSRKLAKKINIICGVQQSSFFKMQLQPQNWDLAKVSGLLQPHTSLYIAHVGETCIVEFMQD